MFGWLRARAWLLALLGLAQAGCSLDLPDEWLIEDLRVLEIRADPPEIPLFVPDSEDPLRLDPAAPPAFDFRSVKLSALVAHPDLEAGFDYAWSRCDLDFDGPPCEPEQRKGLGSGASPAVELSPVALLVGDLAVGEGRLEDLARALAEDPRDLLNGFWANINLSVSLREARVPVDTTSLEATKRVVIFDPRIVAFSIEQARRLDPKSAQEAAELGLPSLCVGATQAQVDAIFEFLRTREPNRPPIHRGVSVIIPQLSRTASRAVGLGETLTIERGQSLELRGVLREGDAEPYVLVDGNCLLQAFREKVSFSWFVSGGELKSQLTTEDSPETRWIPPEPPEGPPRYRVFSVLRDGRGGSDATWFDVIVN